MKTLHIFNPEHDIALASGLANFTAPHAGRQLREDLGFLPVLWADADDYVQVDHVEAAQKNCRRLLDKVRECICQRLDVGDYRGPFGIDMMVVKGLPCLLHPCVEINLRRTMGHVALAVGEAYNPTHDDDIQGVMRVVYNGTNYQLKINKRI